MTELLQYTNKVSSGFYRHATSIFARINQAESGTKQTLYASFISNDKRLKSVIDGLEEDKKSVTANTLATMSTTATENNVVFKGKFDAYKSCLDEFAPLSK